MTSLTSLEPELIQEWDGEPVLKCLIRSEPLALNIRGTSEEPRVSPTHWTGWLCKYIVDQWWGLREKMGAHSLSGATTSRSITTFGGGGGGSTSFGNPRIMILMDSKGLSTLYAADRFLRSMQKITMVLLVAVLVFVTSSGLNSNEILGTCPKECQCYNLQVDCSERGLHSVPKGIPRNVEKMWVISSFTIIILSPWYVPMYVLQCMRHWFTLFLSPFSSTHHKTLINLTAPITAAQRRKQILNQRQSHPLFFQRLSPSLILALIPSSFSFQPNQTH